MGATSSRGIARRIGASLLAYSAHAVSGDSARYHRHRSRGRTTRRPGPTRPARVDRAPGLFALIPLAGAAAAYALVASPSSSSSSNDPGLPLCRAIALASAAVVAALAVFGALFVDPTVRRWLRADRLLRRMPMQAKLRAFIRALDGYRRHPRATAGAVARALPAHAVRILLTAVAGAAALGLPLAWHHYAALVPVVVLLAASVPFAPQGVGVMEAAAFLLGRAAGLSAAQAVCLALAVRAAAIVCTLAGVAIRRAADDGRPGRARRRVADAPPAWAGENRGGAADFPEPA
jgi:hypothetical protein